jgi:hypothetical protein
VSGLNFRKQPRNLRAATPPLIFVTAIIFIGRLVLGTAPEAYISRVVTREACAVSQAT